MNVIVSWYGGRFSFQNRSRLEYRNREEGEDIWRYRNRLQVVLPVVKPGFPVVPYIAEEVFIDLDGEGLNQNRIYIGGKIPLGNRVQLDAFYLWKASEKDDDWEDTSIVSLTVSLGF